jgi:hypothetical protein
VFNQGDKGPDEERLFSRRRIRTLILGTAVAIVGGLVAVNSYMYLQYGGTMFDRYFEKKEIKSPAAGKLAFDKSTKYYIGIIRGEGHTSRQGDVYYIEQPGGTMVAVAKANIEVREPEKAGK